MRSQKTLQRYLKSLGPGWRLLMSPGKKEGITSSHIDHMFDMGPKRDGHSAIQIYPAGPYYYLARFHGRQRIEYEEGRSPKVAITRLSNRLDKHLVDAHNARADFYRVSTHIDRRKR